jgi:hypothetical protein
VDHHRARRDHGNRYLDDPLATEKASMFIHYYPPGSYPPDHSADKSRIGKPCDSAESMNTCLPTESLRELMKGIVPNDENEAFYVFDADRPNSDGTSSSWRGVRYQSATERVVIAATDDKTVCRSSISGLPADEGSDCDAILNFFINIGSECSFIEDVKIPGRGTAPLNPPDCPE